jgi:hypothetical protein
VTLLAVVLTLAQGLAWRAAPAGATVGDTIVLERVVPAAAGARGRTRGLDASELVEPLGVPEILPVPDGLRIRHRVALFAPGIHALAMPAIELLHPDGAVEVVLGDTAFVRVAAVIPDTLATPAPMPSQGPIGRPARRPWRAAVPVAVVVLLTGLWLAWRLRSRREVVADATPDAAAADLPLMRWLAAGERRAVATIAVHRLRATVAGQVPDAARASSVAEWAAAVAAARPDWPVDEVADILRALERARFAPLGADDLAELVDRADVAGARLVPGAERPPA